MFRAVPLDRVTRWMALGLLVAAAMQAPAAAAGVQGPPAAVVGVGLGATWVDLPDPNPGRTDLGVGTLLRFDLGYAPRPWFEIGGELGLGFLGESDSLNAVLAAEGVVGIGTRTHVQALAVARARWLRAESRWAPFARAGAGVAGLSLAAPGGLGDRDLDPAWTAGAGIEWFAHPRLIVRAEGAYLGQAAAARTAHHATACLTLHVGVPRAELAASTSLRREHRSTAANSVRNSKQEAR